MLCMFMLFPIKPSTLVRLVVVLFTYCFDRIQLKLEVYEKKGEKLGKITECSVNVEDISLQAILMSTFSSSVSSEVERTCNNNQLHLNRCVEVIYYSRWY